MIVEIVDELHAELQGEFADLQTAIAELKRRAQIRWDQQPNRPPCESWSTCGRKYVLIEYDDASLPWTQLRSIVALEVSASGIKWSPDIVG